MIDVKFYPKARLETCRVSRRDQPTCVTRMCLIRSGSAGRRPSTRRVQSAILFSFDSYDDNVLPMTVLGRGGPADLVDDLYRYWSSDRHL